MSELPPLITPILTALIFDQTMPAALFRSYVRLYAAAWQNAYRHTAQLHFESQLLPLLGVSRSQARQHLRLLRFAKLLTWTSDGAQNYVIHFPAPESEKAEYDVVRVNTLNNLIPSTTQQTHTAKTAFAREATPDHEKSAALAPPPCQTTLTYLCRAGVWYEVAERIAAQIAQNRQRGHHYLPDIEDVLGWMLYCFAYREENHISQPAAVLAANLKANRRCPEEYRPPRICTRCQRIEEYCVCEEDDEDEGTYTYPEALLELALKPHSPFATYLRDRWGICMSCHALVCQCWER